MNRPDAVRVWDIPVRLLHWVLVVAVAVAWFSADSRLLTHEAAGWIALAAVVLRVLHGLTGRGHARFAAFVHGPRHTLRHAAAVLRGREPRHLGHNPLGGWMAVALLACVAALGVTGCLYTTDAWWGDPGLEAVHRALGWLLVGLAGVHLAGVVHASLRHRENLVGAMIAGRKRPPHPEDVA